MRTNGHLDYTSLSEEQQRDFLKNMLDDVMVDYDVEEETPTSTMTEDTTDDEYNEDEIDEPQADAEEVEEDAQDDEPEPEPEPQGPPPPSPEERCHEFARHLLQVFGSIYVADRTRERCQHLYYDVITDATFADIPYDAKINILEMMRLHLDIPEGAFPLIKDKPNTELEELQEREKKSKQTNRDKKLLHTRDVTKAFECLQHDICDPDFLEYALSFQPDVVKWKTLLTRINEEWGLTEKEFLMVLDDYMGDSSEELSIQQIRAMETQPVEWLIDGFLTQEGMSTFVAPPKAGKTHNVEWMAYCVASGREWMGLQVRQPMKVFYVGVEAHRACFVEDMKTLERNHGLIQDDYFVSKIGVPQKRLFPIVLEEKLKQGYKFIILDMIIDCVVLQSTNDYAQVISAIKPLRRLAQKYGAHIMCVHHASKGGEGTNAALGSQAFRGIGDLNIWLTGEKKQPRFMTTENRIPERHGGMTFDGVEIVLYDDGSMGIGTRRAMTKNQNKILKLVVDVYTVVQAIVNNPEQKWNASSLKKLLTGDNNNKTAVLNKCVTSGILASTKQGNSDIYTVHERYATLAGLDLQKALSEG